MQRFSSEQCIKKDSLKKLSSKVGERSEISNLLSRDSNAIMILFEAFDLGE
jgi:hypothetical protein